MEVFIKCIDCIHLRINDECFYCANEDLSKKSYLSVNPSTEHLCSRFINKNKKLLNKNNVSSHGCCCNCKYFRESTGMCHNLENARLIGNEIILGAFLKGHNQVTDVALSRNYCCDYFEEYELPF